MKLYELLNEIDVSTMVNWAKFGGQTPDMPGQPNQDQNQNDGSQSAYNDSGNYPGIVAPESGGLLTPAKSGSLINNPGNVKYSATTARYPGVVGKKGQFCVFHAPEYGIAASMKRLSVYRANTLFQALNIYAPASDGNNPAQYASVVHRRTGINPNAPINLKDTETLKKVIPGMLWMECNAQYSNDVINKAAEIYQSISGSA